MHKRRVHQHMCSHWHTEVATAVRDTVAQGCGQVAYRITQRGQVDGTWWKIMIKEDAVKKQAALAQVKGTLVSLSVDDFLWSSGAHGRQASSIHDVFSCVVALRQCVSAAVSNALASTAHLGQRSLTLTPITNNPQRQTTDAMSTRPLGLVLHWHREERVPKFQLHRNTAVGLNQRIGLAHLVRIPCCALRIALHPRSLHCTARARCVVLPSPSQKPRDHRLQTSKHLSVPVVRPRLRCSPA